MRKNNFGWVNQEVQNTMNNISSNPHLNQILQQEMDIHQEQQRIVTKYLDSTIFFTNRAGLYYNWYRNMDFEVMSIHFRTPGYPTIPTFTLLHVRDDPRDPDNLVDINFLVTNFNMIRGGNRTSFGKKSKKNKKSKNKKRKNKQD